MLNKIGNNYWEILISWTKSTDKLVYLNAVYSATICLHHYAFIYDAEQKKLQITKYGTATLNYYPELSILLTAAADEYIQLKKGIEKCN